MNLQKHEAEVFHALWPLMALERWPQARLSLAVSEFFKLSRDSAEAAHYDHQFDAGEWSDAAHAELFEKNCEKLAQRWGFADFDALHKAVAERTSERWAHQFIN